MLAGVDAGAFAPTSADRLESCSPLFWLSSPAQCYPSLLAAIAPLSEFALCPEFALVCHFEPRVAQRLPCRDAAMLLALL